MLTCQNYGGHLNMCRIELVFNCIRDSVNQYLTAERVQSDFRPKASASLTDQSKKNGV